MKIGYHIRKSKSFLNSLSVFYGNGSKNAGKPVQLFSGAPKAWRRPTVSDEDLIKTSAYIEERKLRVFIHALYLINLCWDSEKLAEKGLPCLKWELATGKRMGFKGVIVHCGKSCEMKTDVALDNMHKNLCLTLEHIDTSCPLLLETTSGQGTETCWKYADLKKFYSRFTIEQRKKIKICIDTCHVFAAGHDPFAFILSWVEDFPDSLRLVHFNDSKEKCGSRKDRHRSPGFGEIGPETMMRVATWCIKHDIPMVIE